MTSDGTTTGSTTGSGSGAAGETTDVEALAARLLDAGLGAFDLLAVHVGDQLGWYRVLASGGPMTSAELAAASGTAERFAREWLEQQAVTGLRTCGPRRQRWTGPGWRGSFPPCCAATPS